MDPWAEFLRRILLSASLAGVGGISATAAEGVGPAAEIAEAETQPAEESAGGPAVPRAGGVRQAPSGG